MSGLICIAGGKGSPGATSLALALALSDSEPVTLVDADPDGGDLAAWLGISATPGLVSLAAAVRHSFAGGEFARHVQHVQTGIKLLGSPSSPEQVEASLTSLGRPFAQILAAGPAIADIGRWRSGSPATELVRTAHTVVLVVHPTVAGVAHARYQYEDLTTRCPNVVVACRGDRPYDGAEVAEVIGCASAFSIPTDRVGASMLTGSNRERWLRRTPLVRSARDLRHSMSPVEEVAS